MVNSGSYEAVKQELQNICNSTVSGGKRKWTVIGCDGLPYILCSRLIDKDPGLQNVLIQPGLGHFEMTRVKVYLNFMGSLSVRFSPNVGIRVH
jgi:hypothetical protein